MLSPFRYNSQVTGYSKSDKPLLITGGGSAIGTVTSVQQALAKDGTETLTGGPITTTGTLTRTAVDPGADRIVFWDDSADTKTYLALGSGLSITGTTLDTVNSGTVTSVQQALAKDGTETLTGGPITGSGTLTRTAVDPGADRIVFWDDSADAKAYLTVGTGLSISGTTITATGTGTVSSVQQALAKDTTETLTGGPITTSGTLTRTAVDAGADKIVFWDDSADTKDYASLGGSIAFSGTTLDIFIKKDVTVTVDCDGFGILFDNGGTVSTDEDFTYLKSSGLLQLTNESINAGLALSGPLHITPPVTDGNVSGPSTEAFNSGYTSSAVGDLVYLDVNATWQKTDANTLALYNGLLGIALQVKAAGAGLQVALPGSIVHCTVFPALTVGAPVYMSEVAGAITQTPPPTADAAVRTIGWAVHADKIYFNPSPDYGVNS